MAKRKKTIISGPIVETIIYTAPEPNDAPHVRAVKSQMTRKAQKAINDRTARQRLARLIYANFTGRDTFLTLTYRDSDLPSKRKTALSDVRTFLRCFREHRKQRGRALRYIYVTENKHGAGRFHHHVIVNRGTDDLETIRSLWTRGDVIDVQSLGKQDFTGWAQYMTKESGDRPNGAQMWTCSRNLQKPIEQSWYVGSDESISPPPGAYVLEQSEEMTTFGSYRYIRYMMPGQRE